MIYAVLTDIPLLFLKDHKDKDSPKREPVAEFKSPAVLVYVQGISEPLHRSLEQQSIRTVFKSDTTRHTLCDQRTPSTLLNKMAVSTGFPASAAKTGKPTQERIKENDRDVQLARTQTSAVSEHVHETNH